MNLEALVGKNLARVEPAAETVRRLLSGADRHIADAKVKAISAETRFVSAYTAIRMLGDLGLHVHGYRTRTSAAGQHVIAIRALNITLGVSERVVERLAPLPRRSCAQCKCFSSALPASGTSHRQAGVFDSPRR